MWLGSRFCTFVVAYGLSLTSCLLAGGQTRSSNTSIRGATSKKTTLTSKSDGSSTATDGTGKKDPNAQVASGLADAVLQQTPEPGADYIPCRFTYPELMSLVTPEIVTTLTPADAESLVQSVTSTIEKQQAAGLLDNSTEQELLGSLNSPEFVGLTPSQAVSLVIRTVQVVRAVVRSRADANQARLQADIARAADTTAEDKKAAIQAATRAATDAKLASTEALSAAQTGPLSKLAYSAEKNADAAAQAAADSTQSGTRPANISSISDYLRLNLGNATGSGGTPQTSSTSDTVTAAAVPIVASAQNTVNRLVRPTDIGCAMSVLSWDETRQAYGRIIAGTYIAVQVVVRNLSREQQFLLHDVEMAVNVDPNARVGRFFSGRDKVVVRALAAEQQNFDARNIIVHGAEGIGAIMSAAVPVFGGSLADAAGVYNGAFFPGLSKSWKDLSVDQLNLLNDTGFSSTSSSQMVVPKSGTVMFVTFVPAKQFEQGWWTRKCASAIYLGQIADKNHRAWIPLTTGASAAGNLQTSAPSYDVEHAIVACRKEASGLSASKAIPTSLTSDRPNGQSQENLDLYDDEERGVFLDGAKTPYKKWSGNALAIFQELSTAIVAGMHIVDETALQSNVAQLKCDTDADTGKIKFPLKDTGNLACTAAGKNLDKVKLLRLRNAQDAADAVAAEGSISLSGGDNTTATVLFPTASLHALPGTDYAVMSVDKSGAEAKTALVLHLDNSPYVAKVDQSSIDLSKPSDLPTQITLTGERLSDTQSLTLKVDSASITLPKTGAASQEKTASFGVNISDLSKLGEKTAQVTLFLDIAGKPPSQLSQTIKYTPAVKSVDLEKKKKTGKVPAGKTDPNVSDPASAAPLPR